METEKWSSFSVEDLFGSCDLDKSGYIDRHELAAVCDLDDHDLNEIFYQLDLDNDGRISVEEFSKNFQNFSDFVADLKSTKESEGQGGLSKSRKGLAAFKNDLGLDSCLDARFL
ncbi:ras and EF-hand domain-containing protein homolog [Dendronephthya gigantea]|uniref:ras and EF-hand domain-containing protein homolog n=1 Tax=Dendronephthya gigantea TaxID=151771 RepID=UPI00106CFDA0|nr:ras and EF-hand domain-containing protein homolog [Dendronephthya gigantea]